MRKILGTAVLAISLIGGATVVLAQSSRDLTEPTGTEANRVKTQTGGAYYGRGYARMRTCRACTDDGIGRTGIGDLSERRKRRQAQSLIFAGYDRSD